MALEIFRLIGSVFVDTDKAEKSLQKTDKSASKFGQTLANGVKAAGKFALGVGAAAGTAALALGKASVASYAEYEQLVGGVDTLFKDSSKKVQEYANQAYKTAGLSANQYMETVTSFSASLLQSLNGDTAKAAKVADMAIVDMADNANKMGTSMDMIQNAYQGFAKQNYTMLDNLKLGYGGTKEEMQRLLEDATKLSGVEYDISNLNDVYEAIHVVQTELGITGTTAKEASGTIAGSIASMKASWSNLLTALSSDTQDLGGYIDNFVGTVATAADNFLPRLGIALGGVVKLVEALVPKALDLIPELLDQLLPSIVGVVGALVSALPGIFSSVLSALADLGPELVRVGLEMATSLFEAVMRLLPSLVISLGETLLGALLNIVDYLPQLVSTFTQLIVSLAEALPGIFARITDTIPSLIAAIGVALQQGVPQLLSAAVQVVSLLLGQIPVLIPQIVSLCMSIIMMLTEQLPVLLPQLINALVSIVVLLTEQLPVIIPMLIDACITLVLAIVDALPVILSSLLEALPAALQAVWDLVVMVFEKAPEWFGQLFDGAVEIIISVFSVIGQFFADCWTAIKQTFAPVGSWFKGIFSGAWNGIKSAWSSVTGFFSNIWSGIRSAFGAVGSWFKDTFSRAWQAVKDVFSTGGKIFDGIKSGIANVFKTTVNGIIGGINKVISVPFNALNNILSRIKNIEVLSIKPFTWIHTFNVPQIPKLETGAVLEKGQVGLLEGNGAEAVVPLHQNQKWINAVAQDMDTAMGGAAGDQVVAILMDILAAIEALTGMGIYLDTDALVGGIARPMDRKLGQLQAAKGRA